MPVGAREQAMHFDDRLATVLRNRAGGKAMARIQYRQLLDLLGTLPADARGPTLDAAYSRLGELSESISAQERAAMLADPGLRLRSPRIVATLAEGEAQVAVAALRQAQLGREEWLDLVPALSLRARGVMHSRRDLGPEVERLMHRLGIRGTALPPTDATEVEASVAREPAPGSQRDQQAESGIGAIVRRIEDFRRLRRASEAAGPAADSPRLPLGDAAAEPLRRAPAAFDFATDGDGRVTWADAGLAPMIVGLRLAERPPGASANGPASGIGLAVARHQPIRGATIEIAGAPAIAGRWRIDAAPKFDAVSGRFLGYVGRLRRPPAPAPGERAAMHPEAAEADRMRQLIHELRTPVTAIQGFAEVIQQGLFGPPPHEYRALAATIAGDAARILAGFDELDRLARLDAGALVLEPGGCDFAGVLTVTTERLERHMAQRGSAFDMPAAESALPAAVSEGEAARLAWRLLATLASACAPFETLALGARMEGSAVRLIAQLPRALAELEGEGLFRASAGDQGPALSAGMFGTGFALRLARAEARAAGGEMERRGDCLHVSLPGTAAMRPSNAAPLAQHEGAAHN